MNLRQIQDIAGHRDVPPWVIKLVQDVIEHDRMYERPSRAAMQMALEALERLIGRSDRGVSMVSDTERKAVEALREALNTRSSSTHSDAEYSEVAQPQGEWVDLTDDEVTELVGEKAMDMRMTLQGLIKKVLDKFKEKQK